MRTKIIFVFIICALFMGCTIPCQVFFRNLSNNTVHLTGKLVDRWYFDKLPNKVNFYDTAQKPKQIYGNWKYQKLITWTDSTNFYIDVPPYCIIDVDGVSRGLTLGGKQPDVLLISFSGQKADTLTTGDYPSLAAKFQVKRRFFSAPIYYYDTKQ